MVISDGKRIKILNASTEESIADLSDLFTLGIVCQDEIYAAHIKYDCNKGIGKYDSREYYPLTLKGINHDILVSCVTAGYRGEGPVGTLEALELAGFKITPRTENKVLSVKKTNHFIFKSKV